MVKRISEYPEVQPKLKEIRTSLEYAINAVRSEYPTLEPPSIEGPDESLGTYRVKFHDKRLESIMGDVYPFHRSFFATVELRPVLKREDGAITVSGYDCTQEFYFGGSQVSLSERVKKMAHEFAGLIQGFADVLHWYDTKRNYVNSTVRKSGISTTPQEAVVVAIKNIMEYYNHGIANQAPK